jgi:selenide, water dikinase
MTASMTLLNRVGADLAKDSAVHAVTDVTGFGLLGHALIMARGSKLALVVQFDDLPFLSEAAALAQRHFVTGASGRNWASYAESVTLPSDFPQWRRDLLTDPQTSGGLLLACDPKRAAEITLAIAKAGYPRACIIGHAHAGPPAIAIRS